MIHPPLMAAISAPQSLPPPDMVLQSRTAAAVAPEMRWSMPTPHDPSRASVATVQSWSQSSAANAIEMQPATQTIGIMADKNLLEHAKRMDRCPLGSATKLGAIVAANLAHGDGGRS
jgi:hypothetical protein